MGLDHSDLEHLRRKQEGFTKLLKVSEIINSIRTIDELLESVMKIIQEVMEVEASSLLLLDPYSQELNYKIALGEQSTKIREKFTLELGQGIAGWVVENGEPLTINDAYNDNRFFPDVDKATGFTTKAILCVPLRVKGTVWGAIEAINPLRRDAFDELDKEIFTAFAHQVGVALENAQLNEQLRGENRQLKETLQLKSKIIGESDKMKDMLATIAQVATTDSTVLLRGESGTGKEMAARAIHENSKRCNKPFVCVTCSILTETLLESELFGHERGAFTGAETEKKGRFELAAGGTVFLDEIGTLSLNTQIKLLRFLQEKEFERVGGTETIKVNVRIIAATNEDLEKAIGAGRFREDLYYRLKVIELFLPPLRQIKEDIPLLARYYLTIFTREMAKPIARISPAYLDCLKHYDWPGNIRELKNTMERAVVLCKGDQLDHEHLPPDIISYGGSPVSKGPAVQSLEEMEKQHVEKILCDSNWNKSKAAKILGISRNRLERKIKAYDLDAP